MRVVAGTGSSTDVTDGGEGGSLFLIGGEAQGLTTATDHGDNVSIAGGASEAGTEGSASMLTGKIAGGHSGHMSIGTVDAGVSGVSGDLTLTSGSSINGWIV